MPRPAATTSRWTIATGAALGAALLGVTPVAAAPAAPAPTEPTLVARAVLPAATFAAGPPSGRALGTAPINGITPPFASQPVQGVSALVRTETAGVYLALSDNGYGAKANSADFLLRAHRVRPDWERAEGGPGTVRVLRSITFSDPGRRVPHPIVNQDRPARQLTGADFDPESIRVTADGTLWVGEEFGPSLLHFSADGVLLEAPIPIPVPARLAAYGKGYPDVRSPDHPAFAGLPDDAARVAAANLPRSRGIEGMALSADGAALYPSLEGALVDDPNQSRRVVYTFDIARRAFRAESVDLVLDRPTHAIGDLTAAGPGSLLVIERDNEQGAAAVTKRVYELDLAAPRGGVLAKTFLVDLLRLDNPASIGGPATPDTVGLGDPFALPFQTIESLLVLDRRTLVVATDNNFPFSSGRRPGSPDDSEFVQVRLDRTLPPLG